MKVDIKPYSIFWIEFTPKWFRFLEWLIISVAIFLAYLKTKSILIFIVFILTTLFYSLYLQSLLFKVINKHYPIKNSLKRFLLIVIFTTIFYSILFQITSYIVVKLALGTV